MDSLRRKILGRSLPRRGKDRRELRSDVFLRRQSEVYVLEALGPLSTAHMTQEIRNGLRRIYGMQSECTWKTCGVIGWWVLIAEALPVD